MTPAASTVEDFLAAPKLVPVDANMSWRTRNVHIRHCRLRVESAGLRVGELFLVYNVAEARHWSFKLLRVSSEVLRWDYATPPMRHRNPSACGPDFPAVVRTLEHEHIWTEMAGMNCARPLSDGAGQDHRQSLMAFCARAKIEFKAHYQAPPPLGEQLTL
ncbi:hypothetical protein LRS13_08180 [Svornostia abyssi]|uniref:Uncharacterized protein n=1 Tax=Svornostia abyssi TaxID=2898438 RepID=A0ABY5PME0_9ACTN|nr:hypothetical protein LRS13_08180 [Parviterribacteraceae bacterium J379]